MSVENKEIKILIGYVKSFDYTDEQEAAMLNGHPIPGRVYRVIQDSKGYRLHIGREANPMGIDGWMLGSRLKNRLRAYSFDIQIINPENYSDFNIHPDDVKKMLEWLNNKNKDLYDYLIKLDAVAVPSMTPLEELRQLLTASAQDNHKAATSALPIEPIQIERGYTLEIVLIKGDPITVMEVLEHKFSEQESALFVKQSSGYLITVPITNILYTSELA